MDDQVVVGLVVGVATVAAAAWLLLTKKAAPGSSPDTRQAKGDGSVAAGEKKKGGKTKKKGKTGATQSTANATATATATTSATSSASGTSSTTSKKGQHGAKKAPVRHVPKPTEDELFYTSLKGHTKAILDVKYAPDGKHIVTTSEDRSLRLWSVDSLSDKHHQFARRNVELDHGLNIAFTANGRALALGLAGTGGARLFKVAKGSVTAMDKDVASNVYKGAPLIAMGMAATDSHRYFVFCYADTTLIVTSFDGSVLQKINTHLSTNNYAAVSPCGNFFGCCGFTPAVTLWHVSSAAGSFEKCTKGLVLSGHKTSVVHFTFSRDSSHAASISKDGHWRCFNINVRWSEGEDARLRSSGTMATGDAHARIALSSNVATVAVSSGNEVCLFSATSGDTLYSMPSYHTESIKAIDFSPMDELFVTSGDKHVHVWINLPGAKELAQRLKEELVHASTEAAKEHIKYRIKETEKLMAATMKSRPASK